MVLYVFVVAYIGDEDESLSDRLRGSGPVGQGLRAGAVVVGVALVTELVIALLGTGLKAIEDSGAPYTPGPRTFGTPAYIGNLLLTRFLLAFEVASFLLLVAAVGAVVLAGRVATGSARRGRARGGGMSISWYLPVSAIIFALGAAGVVARRNPLVVLLCLELMLNGGNLALVAFARMWGNGDGQVFALIVMTVAACEVAIGLGMIVALYRRRIPVDVDELRELRG